MSLGFTGSLFGTVHFLGAAPQGYGLCCTLRAIKTLLFFSSENKTSDHIDLTFGCAGAQSVASVYRGL